MVMYRGLRAPKWPRALEGPELITMIVMRSTILAQNAPVTILAAGLQPDPPGGVQCFKLSIRDCSACMI